MGALAVWGETARKTSQGVGYYDRTKIAAAESKQVMNETRTGGYAHPDRKNYRADEGGYSLGEHNLLPLHYNLTVRYACLVPTTAIILQVTVIVPLSEVMLTQWLPWQSRNIVLGPNTHS